MKNVLSLECVVDWLGRQKPKTRYTYGNSCTCALNQYFTYVGLPIAKMFSNTWEDHHGTLHPLSGELNNIVLESPHTFGAAYQRGLDMIERNKHFPALIG